MTGPEHYKEAERLLADLPEDYEAAEVEQGAWQSHLTIQRAQVHATLALAAATAYPAVKDYWGDDSNDAREWSGVTG